MAQIKKENVTNIVVTGGKDFEKSGLRDLVIFELKTWYHVPGTNVAGGAAFTTQSYSRKIRYTDFIDPYWWDSGDLFDHRTEADAVRREKGDVLTGFNTGEFRMCSPFEMPLHKGRRFKEILAKEVVAHFVCNEKLRAMQAIPAALEAFEVSFASAKEVRGALVRYEWTCEDLARVSISIYDVVHFWPYGRFVRKEAEQIAIKFVNCPITA